MENNNGAPRKPNPRRKRRTPLQRYIRAYLPAVGVLVLIILFIIFAVGSVRRANERREQERLESIAAESSLAALHAQWNQEALDLIEEAEVYAASCEYDKAIAVLDRFTGDPQEFDILITKREAYEAAPDKLVPVENPDKIPCLSFGRLIHNPDVAFKSNNAENIRSANITTDEFTRILQALYENGYMLVDLDDIFTTGKAADGSTEIQPADLRLPAGKKPILLVHAQSGGYDKKLTLGEDGGFVSEVTDSEGNPTAGSLDFITLLEDFINSNPGFSYKGARAILSVSGVDGVFGNPLTDTAAITALANALKDKGYTLACNSFDNIPYGNRTAQQISEDLAKWSVSIAPLLGENNIMVYARNSDISDGKDPYRGEEYEAMYAAGYRYYFGLCYTSNPWMSITTESVRIGRLLVTGNNLIKNGVLFESMFNAKEIVEES